jgi:hypothetical protein
VNGDWITGGTVNGDLLALADTNVMEELQESRHGIAELDGACSNEDEVQRGAPVIEDDEAQ